VQNHLATLSYPRLWDSFVRTVLTTGGNRSEVVELECNETELAIRKFEAQFRVLQELQLWRAARDQKLSSVTCPPPPRVRAYELTRLEKQHIFNCPSCSRVISSHPSFWMRVAVYTWRKKWEGYLEAFEKLKKTMGWLCSFTISSAVIIGLVMYTGQFFTRQ
jgi:hypothetical protein